MAERSTFQYQPLNLNESEIRLVLLQPSLNPSTPPECTILHAKFSENLQYEALSYMWGIRGTSENVSIVNSGVLAVQPNLFWALKRLRRTSPRLLWIDAICINQEDFNERNHQVSQMGQIYAKASGVVVWLGEDNNWGPAAARLIKSSPSWGGTLAKWFGRKKSEHVAMEDELAWRDLAKLCSNPYWNRLWIIQEVSLAKTLTICWGEISLSWEYFVQIYKYLEDMKPGDRRPKDNVHMIRGAMSSIRTSIPARFVQQSLTQQPEPLFAVTGASKLLKLEPLMNLILYHQGADCKDPRDKIYGLLSLAAECCQKGVVVDYKKSLSEVCEDVLKHHFRQPHWPDRDQGDTTQTLYRIVNRTVSQQNN